MLSARKTALLLPRDPGLLCHCRRIAALSNLIGHHLFLPTEEKTLVCAAALLHHSAAGLARTTAPARLLADVFEGVEFGPGAFEALPPDLRSILDALRRPGTGVPRDRLLAAIVRLSDAFDQEVEALPLQSGTLAGVLELLNAGVEGGLWSAEVLAALRDSTGSQPLPAPGSWRLPVFPAAAARVLAALEDPRADVGHVVRAAGTDPGIAAVLMRLANSALFGARGVSTLPQAIARLGFATARKAVLAAAVRPLLVSPRLAGLWPHSIEVADLAEQLAGRIAAMDPAEAFLAGLLHDAGRIALLAAPVYDSARLEGLERSGIPAVYAENLLLRTDHATLGGAMAASWSLPENIVTAIAFHHRPEAAADPLPHVLYLAEYLSGAAEDLPSRVRLDAVFGKLGITAADLEDTAISEFGSVLAA